MPDEVPLSLLDYSIRKSSFRFVSFWEAATMWRCSHRLLLLGLIFSFFVCMTSQAHGDARNTIVPYHNGTGYRNKTSNGTVLRPDGPQPQIFQLNGTYYSPRTHSNHSTPPLSPVPPHRNQVLPPTPSLSPDFLANATLEEKRALEAYATRLILESNSEVSSTPITDRGLYPVGEAWPCLCPLFYWFVGLDGPWSKY
jgi:hypothetical protein